MTICERQTGGRILCIRLSGLGDVVHTLNALSLLRQERPEAHITWVVESRFSGLLRRHPCIDELITVPRKLWGRMLRNPLRWRALGGELMELARLLRAGRFDVSVDFQSSLKSAWMVAAAGAPVRVGFAGAVNRELNFAVQNHLVRAPTEGVHRIERYLALLAPLGIATRYAAPLVPRIESDRLELERVIAGRIGGGPLVVIHPGTSRFAAFKRWPAERYARLADALIERRGADVVITCGPEDRDVAEQVAGSMAHRGTVLPPGQGLGQMVQLLDRADLFIGGDTGPMHLASALKVPVVALFGPKDPVQTGPYCSRSVVVTGRAPCRPCRRRRCARPVCMTSITVPQVLNAALEVLDGGGRRPAPEGPIRKPFVYAFTLGKWRGQIATSYSAPEFYRRLCDPDAMLAADGAHPLGRPGRSVVVSVPGRRESGARRLVAKRFFAGDGLGGTLARALLRAPALNAWRQAARLELAGVPVPFHVCLMARGGWRNAEHVLFTEELEDSLPLSEHLATNPAALEGELLEALATLAQQLHRGGCLHGGLHAENIRLLGRPEGGGPALCLLHLEQARRADFVPPLLREAAFGRELGGLLASLEPAPGERGFDRFFRAYCDGFIEQPVRRQLIRRAAMRRLRRRQRPPAPERRRQQPGGYHARTDRGHRDLSEPRRGG